MAIRPQDGFQKAAKRPVDMTDPRDDRADAEIADNNARDFFQTMAIFLQMMQNGLQQLWNAPRQGLSNLFSFFAEGNEAPSAGAGRPAASAPSMAQGLTQFFSGRAATSAPQQPAQPAPGLLALIRRAEGADYNTVFGGSKLPLETMTVNEVLAWQLRTVRGGSPSSAAGAYQFIRGTLQGLKNELGLTGEEKFDSALQDRMAMALLQRRGLDKFQSGTMTPVAFADSLAKEWASLPVANGLSHYAGDGLNHARVGRETVLATLQQELEQPSFMLASAAPARPRAMAPAAPQMG